MTTFLPKMLDLEVLDEAIASDNIPWVPQEPGRWFKPLHFLTASGAWINLVKMEPGRRIRRHVHAGGSVHAYVLEGSWRVFEPAGGAHTLEVLGAETMVTLFTVNGVIQYLDDQGRVDQQDDLRSRRRLYLDYCREQGIEPVALVT
jgi:2,4'-dihydroxyacetophenone dioxygenase